MSYPCEISNIVCTLSSYGSHLVCIVVVGGDAGVVSTLAN